MTTEFPITLDEWILEEGPHREVVISSRARLARNLSGYPFAAHAGEDRLEEITARLHQALEESEYFKSFQRFDLAKLSRQERVYLRESHLISTEFEKGRPHREVYLNDNGRTSIMVNEEDHIRMQTMLPGLQLEQVYQNIEQVEEELEKVLELAYAPHFGYLTACPTNTGTGLRVSVMLHLVGLVLTNQIEEALGSLNNFGLVVRGSYGEHSAHVGDIFQVSNEITLGKTEQELIQILEQVVRQIIGQELQARENFHKHSGVKYEDTIHRALGLLQHARTMDSKEAATLLSRVRLGVGGDYGLELGHEQLSRLVIDVQPAHLRRLTNTEGSVEEGDMARANLLRERFMNGGSNHRN